MSNASRQTLPAPIRRIRFVYVAALFCIWTVVIGLRLTWLQVVRHQDFVQRAARQQEHGFDVAPRRGVLYDRNMRELAMTVLVDSVYAVPSEMSDKAMDADVLSKVIHSDPLDTYTSRDQIYRRLSDSKNFAWVARKLNADTAQRVRELNLKGVYFQKEFKRFYPNNEMAAQVLGYVGTDDTGLGGLEREFDDDMHGEPGHVLTAVDAKRHWLGSTERDPMPGENLLLTIDANIQYMAERALDAQMAKVKALHGTVVVQDPHTGQILALAVWPRFNPNDSRHLNADALTDLAVSDVYEPGSTFKLVTYSAALDSVGVQPDDIVDCQGGKIVLYGRTIHDDKSDMGMGRVTVQVALERSSDVAAVKMALKMGPDTFYKYMRAYGFGDRSGVELPAETRGLLRPPRRWGATSIGSLAIGQEVGVTPVQLVTMVSAIANGGVYMPPHILLQSSDDLSGGAHLRAEPFRPENELPAQLPDGAHRVIRELTAAKMRMMMQGIVMEGTGKAAQLNGYSSGGKTGTAQKIDVATHTYSKTKYVASFAGMAPVSNPAITVAVVIDSPSVGSYYGAAVSAPVFQDVAQQVLEYLGVPHDQPLKSKKELQLAKAAPDDFDDSPQDSGADLNEMFAQVNSLPSDDPLRASAAGNAPDGNATGGDAEAAAQAGEGLEKGAASAKKSLHAVASSSQTGVLAMLPEKVLAAFRASEASGWLGGSVTSQQAKVTPLKLAPIAQMRANGAVVVDASSRVAVPSFEGEALREVVEKANEVGLSVQPVGSGLAREQVPAVGTMVPAGTEVVVRFSR